MAELTAATRAIVESTSDKNLIVAGPGTGKTFTFRKILEANPPSFDTPLVLTFLNNLKDDLDRELREFARVYTFHGFCRALLHAHPTYRQGLTESFDYYPPLPRLIKRDWEITRGAEAPQFVAAMRKLDAGHDTEFYAGRATYYNAVSYDDSVFRVHEYLQQNPSEIPAFPLILVDEYQDFNQLEVSFLELLAQRARVVIAGDDDQALYANLRGASPEFVRQLHGSGEFDVFELPFSMRCTEPIVSAVHQVIGEAQSLGLLAERISKRYEYFPDQKANDTRSYPAIVDVRVTVQRERVNYFGRYIEQQIGLIPLDEIKESHDKHFPTVLIIGPRQYRRQVQDHLERQGLVCESSRPDQPELERLDALRRIERQPDGNLGWRILLEIDRPLFTEQTVGRSVGEESRLPELLPEDFKAQVAAEIELLADEEEPPLDGDEQTLDDSEPTIRLTSFEGAKGLSAQHVFVVGLHSGDLPSNPGSITDIEVCKFLVALTRTRKQCHLLHASRWGAQRKLPSPFISWVRSQTKVVHVNKGYW